MKNIHKIIESPTEITDKCAWWYNTITGETLRWNGTIWEVVSQGGGSSQLEAGEGITIENNTISTNIGGDIVVNSNNNLSIWQIPGVKRIRFLNKGRVDLNRKYEVGLIPPSTKSRFIRFIHTDIASLYTETITIPGNPDRDHGIDVSSQLLKRKDLVNKTQVFLNDAPDPVQFDIQYKLKIHSNVKQAGRGFQPHRVNPENSLWDDSGLRVFSAEVTEAQFKAIPYIVILNPFIEYGGKLIYKYEVVNGNYIINVKTEDIKHKEVLFDTKDQQYLEFQEAQQGKISCTKGSFTPKKYLYTHMNKISNNSNFWYHFIPKKAQVKKYSNKEARSSYEKVLDYVEFLASLSQRRFEKYTHRNIIVMCIDKLAKHRFSGLEEREVWKDKNLEKNAGGEPKVGHKIFRIQ